MLEDKINYYKENWTDVDNTPCHIRNNFFSKGSRQLALANAPTDLEQAYKNFFRDKA